MLKNQNSKSSPNSANNTIIKANDGVYAAGLTKQKPMDSNVMTMSSSYTRFNNTVWECISILSAQPQYKNPNLTSNAKDNVVFHRFTWISNNNRFASYNQLFECHMSETYDTPST